MNPLYQLNLDFAKGLNFTKAIMARQGDAGVLVEVHPFMKGVQVVPAGYTFTLKGTTPSGKYVDAVGTIKDNVVEFSLDGRFMSESGYYSNCYVEMSKGDTVLTSQDIIFFSLKVSDITQGQGAEYVSRLEQLLKDFRAEFDTLLVELNNQFNELKIKADELIKEYNKQLADALAKFQKDVQDSIDKLNATAKDLEGRYNQLDELAKSLDTKVNELKEEIAKLGNLHVMYSNSIDFGDYDYSGNPNLLSTITSDYFTTKDNVTIVNENRGVKLTFRNSGFGAETGNVVQIKPQTTYTLSAKVTVNEDFVGDLSKIRLTYRKFPGGNILLGTNLADTLVGETKIISVTGSVSEMKQVERTYLRLDSNSQRVDGSISIEYIKLEEGSAATPYQPNLLEAPYELTKDTTNSKEYKYRGIGMRDSDNPNDYVWDLEPNYVEDRLATESKVSEILDEANQYTDNKVAAVNTSLTNTADDLAKKINANTDNITANTNKLTTISNAMPVLAVYGEGTNIRDGKDGGKLPIGKLIGLDFFHNVESLPYTISSDGITLTATKQCVLLFEGAVKLHGNNTIKYAYIKIRKNGSDTNFANIGSSAALNYVTTQAGQYVHTLTAGDKVEFTLGIDPNGVIFNTQLLSLKITELKPV